MEDAPRLLVVEDDPIYAKILTHQLKSHYQVTHVLSGEDCLSLVQQGGESFDLILLDVMLPGLDGYSVCAKLKEDENTAIIPVLFLSANFGTDDRLRGYEVGGFDYLVKPAAQAELLRKIGIILRMQDEKRHLKEDAASAFNTAISAMTNAAELGLILYFLKKSFSCFDYTSLANAVLETTSQFGLDASLQIRGAYETLSMGSQGPCSPLEVSVLGTLSTCDRIVDFGRRTAISYERVSLIIKNMPEDNPERYGQLKDSMAMLAEGVDARVRTLDTDLALARKAEQLVNLIRAVGDSVSQIDHQLHALHARHSRVFNRLISEMETAIPSLELSVAQERLLENILKIATEENLNLADDESSIDRNLYLLMEILHTATQDVHATGARAEDASQTDA